MSLLCLSPGYCLTVQCLLSPIFAIMNLMRKSLAVFTIATLSLLLVITVAVSVNPSHVYAQQSRAELEQELADLEAQIKSLGQNISATQQQGKSLKNDISILTTKIAESKLKIQKHLKAINQLSQNITQKNQTISDLDAKTEREKESLSQIMRKTMYLEQHSLIDFGLQSKSLSSF